MYYVRWVGGLKKMKVLADIQYCNNAEIMGGSENIKKYVDLIY